MGAISGTTIATMMAIKVGSDIVGGAIGGLASQGDRDQAEKAMRKALAEIDAIGAGPDLAKQIFYREFESAGVLTPEIEKAVQEGVSSVAQIQEDPKLKKAQMEALSAIQQRGRTGFTPQEMMQLRQERSAAERSAESKRQQILAGLRARGALDSGAGLAAQLQSADELAARQFEASDRAAAMADQRALQSMVQAGQLSGQIRAHEFDVDYKKQSAEEAMKKFNITNMQEQERRRADRETQARQYNLATEQQLLNMKTQLSYQELLRQRNAQQQMYENELRRRQLRGQMYGSKANFYNQRAGQTQQNIQGIASGIGDLASTLYGMGGFGSGAATGGAAAGAGNTPWSLGVVPPAPPGGNIFGVDTSLGGNFDSFGNFIKRY